MRRGAFAALAALLIVSGCAGPATKTLDDAGSRPRSTALSTPTVESPLPGEVTQGDITYLDYKPGKRLTVLRSGSAERVPVVVILHGYNVETDFYVELARAVAKRGAVVFLPEWDDLPSPEDPREQTATTGLDDVADAMRFTQLNAARYGGDPERVVIVGHSLGAVFALTTMLAGDQFGTSAFPHEVSALPDAYVSLDGVVPFRETLWNEDLRARYDKDPATWDKTTPTPTSAETMSGRVYSSAFLVATLHYALCKSMAKRMGKRGYKTKVSRMKVDHMQAAEPQTETVDAIIGLAHAGRP